jgi:EAL domain-containing protein (putative c-di-GMP-specific phosphodiesterase class I)
LFDDVTGDARGRVVVGAVIALAHAAGLPVAVEGIETQAEADIALGAGADVVQGFYFSPPLSASSAESYLRALSNPPFSPCNNLTTE